jgi:hypothetical protein
MIYTIKKGIHFSTPRTNMFAPKNHTIEGVWQFNETIKYEADAENDWNKLYGIWFVPPISWLFKNPTKSTRYNCAMVAFRWKNNQLELAPYLHRKGSVEYVELLGTEIINCSINTDIYTKIEVLKQSVVFTINDKVFTFDFPKHSDYAFRIQPYFGGQLPAPHNITISKNEANVD